MRSRVSVESPDSKSSHLCSIHTYMHAKVQHAAAAAATMRGPTTRSSRVNLRSYPGSNLDHLVGSAAHPAMYYQHTLHGVVQSSTEEGA